MHRWRPLVWQLAMQRLLCRGTRAKQHFSVHTRAAMARQTVKRDKHGSGCNNPPSSLQSGGSHADSKQQNASRAGAGQVHDSKVVQCKTVGQQGSNSKRGATHMAVTAAGNIVAENTSTATNRTEHSSWNQRKSRTRGCSNAELSGTLLLSLQPCLGQKCNCQQCCW